MLYIVSDHAGHNLKQKILPELNIEYVDLNPNLEEGDDYPDKALLLQSNLQEGDLGLAICGTGQGMAISLNKYLSIRAGVTENVEIAKLIRQHNHANVLCLGARFINKTKALAIFKAFLEAKPSSEPRHLRRVKKVKDLIL